MNSNKKIWLILIAALGNMIAPFSIDTYLPSFPAIESYYGVSREIMTTTMGAYLAAFAITTLAWGPLADRFGRKPTAITSLAGFTVVSAGCALSPTFDSFMTFRILQGVFAGGVIIAGRAMIRDSFPPKEAQKAMALIMMVFAIAPAIAPIIGGFLQHHYDWESIFWFLSVYGIITFLLITLFLKETQPVEHIQSIAPKKLMASYLHSLQHPVFLRIVLAQSFVFGGFFVYVVGSASLIFDHLHLGAEDFWIQFVPVVGGMMLGSFFSHRVSNHKMPVDMANIAFTIGTVAVVSNLLLVLFTAPQIMTTIPQLCLYAFGLTFALPVLSILATDCLPEKRGMATSLQSLMQMGMMALVSILVVPLVHASLLEMAVSMAALWFLGWLLWMNVQRRLPKQAEQIHEF